MPCVVGVDETGQFRFWDRNDKSFAAAVVTDIKNDFELYKKIWPVYEKFLSRFFGNQPSQTTVLRSFSHKRLFPRRGGAEEAESQVLSVNDAEAAVNALLRELKRHIRFVVRTEGTPILLTNQQHWWIASIRTALDETTRLCRTLYGIEGGIEFRVDPRASMVLGLFFGEDATEEERAAVLAQYNTRLERHLQNFLQSYAGRIDVNFKHDTDSFHVMLADIICGVLRNRPSLLSELQIPVHQCGCVQESHANLMHELVNRKDYAGAVRILVEQAARTDQAVDKRQLTQWLSRVREGDEAECRRLWSDILDFVDRRLEARGSDSRAPYRMLPVLEGLQGAVNQNWGRADALRKEVALRTGRVHLSALTHVGSIDESQAEQYLDNFPVLSKSLPDRARRWEALVEAKAAQAQILLNDFRFESAIETMLPLLDGPSYPAEAGIVEVPDDTMAKVYGTVGQAYAFIGDYVEAKKWLKEDLRVTSPRYEKMPKSFLISVYLRQGELAEAEALLNALTEEVALQDFAGSPERLRGVNDHWVLVDILRLLGLRVHLGKECAPIAGEVIERMDRDYPYPLALKWAAFVNAKAGEAATARAMLRSGIAALLKRKEFTTRVLAVPFYLLLAGLVDNTHERTTVHREYTNYITPLANQSKQFAAYLQQKKIGGDLLDDGDAGWSLWDRAMALPFFYS